MSLNTLFAILALVVAVYTILPRSRRLNLQVGLRWLDWFFIGATLAGVHILVFYPSLHYAEFLPSWPLQPKFLTPGQTAYLLILLLAMILALRASVARLSRGKIFYLRELVDELVRSQSYPELFSLLDKNLIRLSRIKSQDFLGPRLRSRLENWCHSAYDWDIARLLADTKGTMAPRPGLKDRLLRIFRRGFPMLGRPLARILPTYKHHAVAASEILHQILVFPPIVAAIAQMRPYFGLRLLELDLYEKYDFLDIYLRFLLDDRHSVLYFELRSNQNVDSNRRYWLPESNRLLHFLFSDARKAEGLRVWKPIGDSLNSRLDELATKPETDPYNQPMGEFDERGKWEDPLYVGIFFFDVMVSLSLHQGVTWHMWLYYFQYFVRGIVRNYRVEQPFVDTPAEWPTKYSFLLYQIVGTITGWLLATKSIPEDQANVKINLSPIQHENGNIPKSAAFCLADCLREISHAEQLPERFRKSLMDMVFRTYFELRAIPSTEKLAEVIRCKMSERRHTSNEQNKRFLEALRKSLAAHDKIPYNCDHVHELEMVLSRGWKNWAVS